MAGLETQHKIVERLEVQNADAAKAAFDKLAGASDAAAKALGHVNDASHEVQNALKGAGDGIGNVENKVKKPKLPKWANDAKDALGKFAGSAAGAVAIGNLMSKALEFGAEKLRELAQAGWEANEVFEKTRNRLQGVELGLVDMGKAGGPEKIKLAQKAANVLMAEFRDTALRTATPIEQIEGAFSAINPILSALGKSQKDVVDLTNQAAAAAKVFGTDAQAAGGIAAKAIFEGNVEGDTPFARALKAQAGDLKKLSVEDRMKKVSALLAQMGGAVDVVASGTGDALSRWQILSTDVLQRVTQPAFEAVGDAVGSIVNWLRGNEATIDAIVGSVREWLASAIDVGKAIWEVVAGVVEVAGVVFRVNDVWNLLADSAQFLWKYVDLIATAWRGIVQLVKVAAGDDEGFGKLVAFSTAIELKWKEIALQILKVVRSFADFEVPAFLRDKIPGFESFKTGLKSLEKDLQSDADNLGKKLRAIEEKTGTGPLTETTRTMAELEAGKGLDKAARDALLSGLKGLKVTQNIDRIEIKQEFREGDPDRVLIEFSSALERIGQAALQSTAGGAATVYEGSG